MREVDGKGLLEEKEKGDKNKQPFTTLGYANGKGYVGTRPNLSQETVTNPDYKQEAAIPLSDETHGGEDVAIYATGAGSSMIRGVMEQNWIFYAMREALRFKKHFRRTFGDFLLYGIVDEGEMGFDNFQVGRRSTQLMDLRSCEGQKKLVYLERIRGEIASKKRVLRLSEKQQFLLQFGDLVENEENIEVAIALLEVVKVVSDMSIFSFYFRTSLYQ